MTLVSEYSVEEISQTRMQKLCDKVLELDNIRFAGLISNRGNLFAGGIKKGVIPKEDDEKRRLMYMRFALESCLRNDFDDSLGPFRYSIIQREKVSIFTTNIFNYLLLVFSEPCCDLQNQVKSIQSIIKSMN
ncbi:MAG TPA: DUF6659 family protein [Nitrosopumilaceae archaeon]|nr:DUF6659 family protein [Nitrosopumilaceae archaeon]